MKKRCYEFEWLRVISCFAIVILHACALALNAFAPSSSTVSAITMSLRNLMMFAVPCFVMITGALLLDPDHEVTINKVLGKYVKRTVVILIVFTLLFSIYDGMVSHTSIPAMVKDWLRDLYANGSWLHMWYLYLMLAIYLSLPLLRKIIQNTNASERKYILIIFLIFQAVIPTLNSVTGISSGLYLLFYSIYPFYLLIGYEIHQKNLVISLPLSIGMIIISAAAIVVMSWQGVMKNQPVLISLSSNYASIAVLCEGIGIFSLFEQMNMKKQKWIHLLDSLTFGIYLIHVLFLKLLFNQIGFDPFQGPIFFVLLLLTALSAFILSAVIVFLLRQSRVIRRYL